MNEPLDTIDMEAAPMEKAAKKAAMPLSVVALVVALLGGGAGGLSFIRDDDDGSSLEQCRAEVATAEARIAKAQTETVAGLRREFASESDVAALSVKIDNVRDMVRDIRDDLRQDTLSRRRRTMRAE